MESNNILVIPLRPLVGKGKEEAKAKTLLFHHQ
jgi:hypothetical protein